MTSPIHTLIHIVSKQTMQNVLPLLAVRPQRVVQICSNKEDMKAAAKWTELAAREAGLSMEFKTEVLASPEPGLEDVQKSVQRMLEHSEGSIINCTGGTKLMAVGAYLGAMDFPSVPILYCDTQNQTFISAGQSPLPALPSFAEITATLTLRIVMAAHGRAPEDWRFEKVTPEQLSFGLDAWNLRTTQRQAFADCQFGEKIRGLYCGPKRRLPSSKSTLQSLVGVDPSSALEGALPSPVLEFLKAAERAGFLKTNPNGGLQLAVQTDKDPSLRSQIEKILNVLDGSWLELSVMNFVSRSSRHRDAHWSVEPTKEGQQNAEYGETDLIVLDKNRAALEIISCKTTMTQPLEHLEGLRTRATNLGGSHALATLAVLYPGQDGGKTIRRYGKLLNVKVLIGEEISQHFTKHPGDAA